MNSGIWTRNEKNIYDKYIFFIIKKSISYKELSLIIKTRNNIQIRTHHQTSIKDIKNASLILLNLKTTKIFSTVI